VQKKNFILEIELLEEQRETLALREANLNREYSINRKTSINQRRPYRRAEDDELASMILGYSIDGRGRLDNEGPAKRRRLQ